MVFDLRMLASQAFIESRLNRGGEKREQAPPGRQQIWVLTFHVCF